MRHKSTRMGGRGRGRNRGSFGGGRGHNNRGSFGEGGGEGGGRLQNQAGGADRQKCSVFTKLLKDENAVMRDKYQARRFLEGMETYQSKAELLAKLQYERDQGLRRVQDLLSFINSTADVETLLVPLLNQILNDETGRPMYRPLRDKMLLQIFLVPNFMNMLDEQDVVAELSEEGAQQFCSFLRALTKPYFEARQSTCVKSLATALRERGDVDEAQILCSSLLLKSTEDDDADSQDWFPEPEAKRSTVACWVTDMEPPGGRHDNDHQNYRDIRIVPTVQELTCQQDPYLPLASGENNFIEDPVAALLDRNFRLLRDDAVSSMKANLLDYETKCWKNARIVDLHVSTKSPRFTISFVVQFDHRDGREINWKKSKALMHGSVVAFCRDGRPCRMGTINVREESTVGEWLSDPGGPKIGVSFESQKEFSDSINEMARNCTWNVTYCDLNKKHSKIARNDPRRAVLEEQIEACAGQLETYDLVEVSKSFFAYQPILKTLQDMDSIPMSGELTGTDKSSVRPEYLPDEIFLPEKDFGGYRLDMNNWSLDDIVQKTSLDRSQAKALHHSLSSRVVLTQGPPGTGKTFLGALVARAIRQNTDETILCVCYTNHALDQFLEHMLDAGEKHIVRMGGRSKSERLSMYQLKELAKAKARNQTFCQQRVKQVHAHLYSVKEQMDEIIKLLKTPLGWKEPSGGIREFLAREDPEIMQYLEVPNFEDTDFTLVGPRGKKIQKEMLWNSWKNGETFPTWLLPHMPISDMALFDAFWGMSLNERNDRIEQWRQSILESLNWELSDLVEDFNVHAKEDKSLCRESELEILNSARVIGATTAGAANYFDLLSSKAAGVVLVEEAGEVLESHVLTALAGGVNGGESSKHLILIGDHKQLPPKVENYKLTTTSGNGYNLDCSLFERLILAGQEAVTLQVQHRMRPCISALIRAQTYPSLRDHESVTRYPEVRGISDNLLFIDHQVPEDGHDIDNSTTKSNLFEANLCIEVVRFMLLQGYRCDQLVVLTPYLGQLLKILEKMRSLRDIEAMVSERDIQELDDLDPEGENHENQGTSHASRGDKKGVRCSSIDNYQGEEADIVIISLVRSNRHGNIGFMKERQRVNVLLSRARYGMVLIGNSSTLLSSKKGGPVWEPILEQLQSAGRLVNGLPTTCQLHPNDEAIELCQPHEFREYRPNGGCLRPCTYRLSCGHACQLKCHPTDRNHENAQKNCCEPCRRFPPECPRKHPCRKLCKEDCGCCRALVSAIPLTCGHIAEQAYCYEVRSTEAIQVFSLKCQEIVTHRFRCGHEASTRCANSRSPEPQCPMPCGALASCQHPCQNLCGSCDGNHDCKQTCTRTLYCGHECGRPCHHPSKCAPCTKPCHAKCIHSFCPRKCSFPCASCVEPCDWQCDHIGPCPLVCGAPCARLPCNERCAKLLRCGHQCPSVCGEDCPDVSFCQQCGTENHLSQVVDMINLATYREHNLNEDPIIFLPCGHFFAVSSMDGILEVHKVYELDERGAFVGLQRRGQDVSEKCKGCPDCRSIIHSVRRYGRILRLIELRSLERKHMAMMDQALQVNEKRIKKLEARPNGSNSNSVKQQMLKHLDILERQIRRSPMNVVFEACGGSDLVEAVAPPTKQLIRCLELRALVCEHWASKHEDISFQEAKLAHQEAILIADESTSRLSGAKLRLSLARLILKCSEDMERVRTDVNTLLDWILKNSQLDASQEVVVDTRELKKKLNEQSSLETIKSVMAAMGTLRNGEYNYGGSASDHWYECPNGHPYFIGECGQAMQESRCLECGVAIGGGSHRLRGDNRQIGGRFRDALSG